ncbi:MAG: STAS domain-containing protein [Rubrivivax sp.]|nr:STAS domain-containing protein [Rubrivivax sp.]
MSFESFASGDVQVIRLAGRLDSAQSPALERALRELLDGGTAKLLLDLGGLDYISSAGLRVVLVAGKSLRGRQPPGRLALCGVRGMVREVFEMSGFLALFPVADTQDAALALLAG